MLAGSVKGAPSQLKPIKYLLWGETPSRKMMCAR
jgi:hypothetical protein